MITLAASELLILVRLNCGEPISVTASHPDLEGIPVVFLETGELAEDNDEPFVVGENDEIVVKVDNIRHEDLEEIQDQLDEAGVLP